MWSVVNRFYPPTVIIRSDRYPLPRALPTLQLYALPKHTGRGTKESTMCIRTSDRSDGGEGARTWCKEYKSISIEIYGRQSKTMKRFVLQMLSILEWNILGQWYQGCLRVTRILPCTLVATDAFEFPFFPMRIRSSRFPRLWSRFGCYALIAKYLRVVQSISAFFRFEKLSTLRIMISIDTVIFGYFLFFQHMPDRIDWVPPHMRASLNHANIVYTRMLVMLLTILSM